MATTRELFERRARRTRASIRKVAGDRLRLTVFRSNRHIYAQVIDDVRGATLAAASTLDESLRSGKGSDLAAAAKVGKMIAERALAAGVKSVVLDRGGYRYHGRVKALADGAREGGLEF